MVKCPHCNEEIDFKKFGDIKKEEVLTEIKNQVHSASSLGKKLEIKRSTLRYYLVMLVKEGKVNEERLENLQGRPTIYRIARDKTQPVEVQDR